MCTAIDKYYSAILSEGLFSSRDNLRFYMETLFRGVELGGSRMLDIGGGSGLYSFYTASAGAREVICLEPEFEGSSSRVTDTFEKLKRQLSENIVRLERETIQSFDAGGGRFDVILLHDSINHLDESACIRLTDDPESRDTYQSIFQKIAGLAREGTMLIVCDCSPHNCFAHLRLPNPFAPYIEWNKHQAPKTWAELLGKAGFGNPMITWTPINRLGAPGKRLTGNRLASYFLTSHFCLKMRKD